MDTPFLPAKTNLPMLDLVRPMPFRSFADAEKRVKDGTASLLDKFIVDNEPSFPDDVAWRKALIEVINCCAGRVVVLDDDDKPFGDVQHYDGHDTFEESAGER